MPNGRPVDEAEFRRLHALGLGRQEIADGAGVRKSSVGRICERFGLEPPPNDPPSYDKFLTIDPEGFKALVASGDYYTRDLAVHYDVSTSTIRKWCHRLKIALPPVPPASENPPPVNKIKIDRGTVKMLVEGKSSSNEIAAMMNCSARQIDRIRVHELKIRTSTRTFHSHPQSVRDEALRLLEEEGLPYSEVSRQLGVGVKAISHWHPGKGWTQKQCVDYRNMLKRLDKMG